MWENGFLLTGIFPYNEKIGGSTVMRQNTGYQNLYLRIVEAVIAFKSLKSVSNPSLHKKKFSL